jgi:hypothetical protein
MNFKKNSFQFEGEPKIIEKNFTHNISNIKMIIKIVLFKRIKKINDNKFYWINYNKIDNSIIFLILLKRTILIIILILEIL